MKTWLAILVLLFGATTAGVVQSVTLAWDASPDPTVTGYYVYFGTASRTYTSKATAGAVLSFTVSNLVVGVRYYFAVTAYDADGLESVPSNEVRYRVPVPGPPPVQVVTVSVLPELLWATNVAGPWFLTNSPLVLTNPTDTRYFKSAGVSIQLTNL